MRNQFQLECIELWISAACFAYDAASVLSWIRRKMLVRRWAIAALRAKRATGVSMKAGEYLERLNRFRRIAAGEKVIYASKTGRGFDLASYRGKGRKAKLFLDECKNWGYEFINGKTFGKKKIPLGRLKTLLKKTEYDLSVSKAKVNLRKLLKAGKIDKETHGTLFHQLKNKTFAVRVVPGPDATVTKEVMSELSGYFRKAKVILDKYFME